ncbi:MAG: hypothetical protein KDJ37_15875 [Hyphomicrobiaceae bacterium]|nr:hypothetical protein [Hyphomicrobiaceae bacterium]
MSRLSFDKASAKRIIRGYHGSYHEVWQDAHGQKMLSCRTRRSNHLGVAVNFAALNHFRKEGGQFVGLMNAHFKVVVPIAQLDGIRPWDGDDFIVIRPGDLGLEVAVEDNEPCPY